MSVELTGRRRYRAKARVFRPPLVVLQVEVRVTGMSYDSYGGGGDRYDYTEWRDATVADITTPLPKGEK